MSTVPRKYDRLTLEWLDDEGNWNLVEGVCSYLRPSNRGPMTDNVRIDRLTSMNRAAYYLTQDLMCAVRVMLNGEGLPNLMVVRRNSDGEVERDTDDVWAGVYNGTFWD